MSQGRSRAWARLASAYGIDASYQDAWGREHRVPLASRQVFLAAMGVGADTPEALSRAVAAAEARPWRATLAPAVVAPESRPVHLPVVLSRARAHAGKPLSWRVATESGTEHDGTVRLAALPLEAAHRLDGTVYERRALTLPLALPAGYHRLALHGPGVHGRDRTTLIAAPERCYQPPVPAHGRDAVWGFAVQLYALRSARNWGIGDFTDLRRLVELTAALGGGLVGLNPLHALFSAWPEHVNPYAPSSREFLNVLYIDVEALPDLADCAEARARIEQPAFRAALAELRRSDLVDYSGVAARKWPILEALYRSFRATHLERDGGPSARGAQFRRFQERCGRDLARFATFEALSEHFAAGRDAAPPWRDWPAPCRDPESPEVARFAERYRDRVEFFQYLQWQADAQLGAAAAAARRLGMPVGLYLDVAVGVDRNGADGWTWQHDLAQGVAIGAPPDAWAPRGQVWGLPPWNPVALRRSGYAPFVALMRANMRHAGALRIDHAMGLLRQFWVPDGAAGTEGGYVPYPLDDLLGIVALESQRARCVVIGEDLGTVPEGFRARMARAAMLSYRLLFFEKDAAGAFLAPEAYPELALAAVTTHDLPPLAGFWRGRDIELRERLGLFPSRAHTADAHAQRAQDRVRLLDALERAGCLDGRARSGSGEIPIGALVAAAYRYLARAPARVLAVHFEDLLGVEDPVNLPGTSDEHPNWRRKLPLDLERLAGHDAVTHLARIMADAGRGSGPR